MKAVIKVINNNDMTISAFSVRQVSYAFVSGKSFLTLCPEEQACEITITGLSPESANKIMMMYLSDTWTHNESALIIDTACAEDKGSKCFLAGRISKISDNFVNDKSTEYILESIE